MHSPFRALLPTNSWGRALLAPVVVFMATAMDRHYLTDFWHHLARGRAIAEQGQLVNHDLFTFTVRDQAFQDNNWLTQLLYYWLYQHGGLNLVVFVNSLTLAIVIGLLVWLCRRASNSAILASGMGILAFLGMWQIMIVRPQTFSFLLFVLLYAVLLSADHKRWLLAFPPLILALWSNLHGGFPIGLILVGAFLLAEFWQSCLNRGKGVLHDGRVWSLAACLALCFLATFLNPYGWNIYRYVLTTSAMAAQRRIDEWVPPGTSLLIGKVFIFSVILLLGLFGLARRRPTVREVCLVLCFLPLACGSLRMIPWWLMIATPIMASLLAETFPHFGDIRDEPDGPTLAAAGFCGILLVVFLFSLPWMERFNPVSALRGSHREEMDLEEVVRALPAAGPELHIFSRFEWGEYLGWRTAPRGRVFMDGRIEIFPDKVWDDYTSVTTASVDWQSVLDQYEVGYLVLDTEYHEKLIRQVRLSKDWQQVDDIVGNVVVFQRTAGAQPAIVATSH